MDQVVPVLMYPAIAIISLLVIGLILTRMYKRAPKDAALIRTGFGGEKVIMNGGVIVLPVLHELMEVSLTTIKLKIERLKTDALITADKIRVDVVGLFHIRVAPNIEAVSAAAQTLGKLINDPNAVRELVEGKLVSALRSVAAKMTMEDLHANRDEFTQKVRDSLKDELAKNGFELETVSLTHFDQTSLEVLNPDNAFDAEGLTVIRKITEDRKKVRNEIEATNRVAIEQRNYEANQKSLEIAQADQFATLAQREEVATKTAETDARISAQGAEQAQAAEQARIDAENATRLRTIEADRAAQTATLEQERSVELIRQDTAIQVAERSQAESVARKAADEAKAQAVSASEGVITARATAEAERTKRIAVISATQEAESKAVSITVSAAAEKDAAADRAEAVKLVAQGTADAKVIEAEASAEAVRLEADAEERRFEVQAQGTRSLNEADNVLSPAQIAYKSRIAVVEALPEVVRESVKPMENIDSIRIVSVAGLGGQNNGTDGSSGGGNFADQAVNAALNYRVQKPIVDSLLADLGFGSLETLVTSAPSDPLLETSVPSRPAASPASERQVATPEQSEPRARPTRRRPEVHGVE